MKRRWPTFLAACTAVLPVRSRELVSNAWDANAKIVRVDTNYPNFYQLSVEDNGDGFTKEEFERVMGGGIGNSEKRKVEETLLKFDRPTIGRLGIGMLGIADRARFHHHLPHS